MALKSTREGYAEALVRLGEVYPELVVLDADVARSTLSIRFGEIYPDRFLDVGAAEQNMLGIAAGLATTGFIPVVNTFAVFMTRHGPE